MKKSKPPITGGFDFKDSRVIMTYRKSVMDKGWGDNALIGFASHRYCK